MQDVNEVDTLPPPACACAARFDALEARIDRLERIATNEASSALDYNTIRAEVRARLALAFTEPFDGEHKP